MFKFQSPEAARARCHYSDLCDLNNLRPDPALKLRLNVVLIQDCTLSDYNLVHAPRLVYIYFCTFERSFDSCISHFSILNERRAIFMHCDQAKVNRNQSF